MKDVLLYTKKINISSELVSGIQSFLKSKKIESLVTDDFSKVKKRYDLIIVIGGDGSFLTAARFVNDTPILGVNAGSLGFLTETKKDQVLDVLKEGVDKGFLIEERTMLEASYGNKKQVALNDIVVSRTGPARVVDINIYYNSEFIANLKSDGVIISTPTGSTAYSLSSGGPILHPAIKCFVITPVSPHTLTNRPIVVSDDGVIKIETSDAVLSCDGQTFVSLEKKSELIIKKADRKIKMIRPYGVKYFDILRDKLHFGKRA